MQALRQHSLALRSLWDVAAPGELESFTTWKFRADGESRRIIDHVWWASLGIPCCSVSRDFRIRERCCSAEDGAALAGNSRAGMRVSGTR